MAFGCKDGLAHQLFFWLLLLLLLRLLFLQRHYYWYSSVLRSLPPCSWCLPDDHGDSLCTYAAPLPASFSVHAAPVAPSSAPISHHSKTHILLDEAFAPLPAAWTFAPPSPAASHWPRHCLSSAELFPHYLSVSYQSAQDPSISYAIHSVLQKPLSHPLPDSYPDEQVWTAFCKLATPHSVSHATQAFPGHPHLDTPTPTF
mmetsp:Transcript_3823/g.7780  ORF Transcript_3823/g.7780 Transcript_3823/m.7780 type:complete len:201 (-) Transcript_3823:290-892(-)